MTKKKAKAEDQNTEELAPVVVSKESPTSHKVEFLQQWNCYGVGDQDVLPANKAQTLSDAGILEIL